MPVVRHRQCRIRWAYGITTVPERKDTLFRFTLNSLKHAGFEAPTLFIDNGSHSLALAYEAEYSLRAVARQPKILTFGNWTLALAELYMRYPTYERFAIFQDDFIAVRNLRQYLEHIPYPDKGYLNLFTFPENQNLAERIGQTARFKVGFYPSNQRGKGAVALIFSREAVTTLLTHYHFVERPLNTRRGWRAIDGGIVTALKKAGWKEYVHNPSPVQHIGKLSSMGNKEHPAALSFPGEDFDALDWLKAPKDERTW